METQTYTIEDLREGRVAVVNDGTIQELRKVLKKSFPEDSPEASGSYKYYHRDITITNLWESSPTTDLPTQSVKVFLKEIELEEVKEKAKKDAKDPLEDTPFYKPDFSHLLDKINPSHYKTKPKETIERIGDNLSLCEFKGYLKGNILKYLDRYENKNGVEDLKKANWYLNKLIELENEILQNKTNK